MESASVRWRERLCGELNFTPVHEGPPRPQTRRKLCRFGQAFSRTLTHVGTKCRLTYIFK